MKILVKEDHRAPVVVSMVWYRAGSMDEVNGTTGVAHVLEHMMFKGTKEVAPGEFSRIIARAGGRDNAFTNQGLARSTTSSCTNLSYRSRCGWRPTAWRTCCCRRMSSRGRSRW